MSVGSKASQWHEILYCDQKVVGSNQKYKSGIGSILLHSEFDTDETSMVSTKPLAHIRINFYLFIYFFL